MSTGGSSPLVILDTDIASFLLRNLPLAQPYLPHLRHHVPAVSAVTVADLYVWGQRERWGPARWDQLRRRLAAYLLLSIDLPVALEWARIQTAIPGRTFPANDAWIGASAAWYRAPVLTHNCRDFEGMPGVTLISYAP